MSDDASYASFLDKANADPKAGAGSTKAESTATSQGRSKFDPTSSSSSSSALPASLKSLPDVTYTSDTDSPFEPVLFSYAGSSLPSAAEFAEAAKKTGDVEELSVSDFDPRGEYTEVVRRVEQAGGKGGAVKVYRVGVSQTRAEYYILTLADGLLLGVMTKAVES